MGLATFDPVLKEDYMADPGFKSVQGKIAKQQGVSRKAAGAILAHSSRNASPKAKRKNPRLRKVGGERHALAEQMVANDTPRLAKEEMNMANRDDRAPRPTPKRPGTPTPGSRPPPDRWGYPPGVASAGQRGSVRSMAEPPVTHPGPGAAMPPAPEYWGQAGGARQQGVVRQQIERPPSPYGTFERGEAGGAVGSYGAGPTSPAINSWAVGGFGEWRPRGAVLPTDNPGMYPQPGDWARQQAAQDQYPQAGDWERQQLAEQTVANERTRATRKLTPKEKLGGGAR